MLGAHFKYYQVKTHVQIACKYDDFNMDYHSFDNDFKQLYAKVSLHHVYVDVTQWALI